MKLVLILILAAMCASAFAEPVLVASAPAQGGGAIGIFSHVDGCVSGTGALLTMPFADPVAGCVTDSQAGTFHVYYQNGWQEDYSYAGWTPVKAPL